MLRRILWTALAAGLVAGVFVSLAQQVEVVPLILEAETYEAGAADHHEAATGTGGEHEHDGGAWAPSDGLERVLFTFLANLLTAIGFALLLGAGFALYGGPVDARRGALWGLAGFAAFALAPAIGLAPELPGSVAAEVGARQVWWLGTAVATAGGIALIVFARAKWLKALGVVLIAVPHLIGAPAPEGHGGTAPPELAAEFAIASLVIAALFWAVLGTASGYFYRRLS